MQVDTIKIKLTYHKLQCNIGMQTAVLHKKNRNIILFHWNKNGNTGSDNDTVAKQSPLHPYWSETISMCAINSFLERKFWIFIFASTVESDHINVMCIRRGIHTGDKPYHYLVCDELHWCIAVIFASISEVNHIIVPIQNLHLIQFSWVFWVMGMASAMNFNLHLG